LWRAPARLLAALVITTFLHAEPAIAGKEFRDRSVIGKWQLVSVLDLASIASLDETDAKALLGKILTISETAVQVDQELCGAPEFWAERVVPEPHMQEKLHSTAQRLRLPNPATMVELGCTDVYIRNPGQLVLLWGGAMFDAVRVDPERRQRPASPSTRKPPLARNVAGEVRKTGTGQKPVALREAGLTKKPGKVQKTAKVQKMGRFKETRKVQKIGRVEETSRVREPGQPSRRKSAVRAADTYANELF
jgi:hypothetical protein